MNYSLDKININGSYKQFTNDIKTLFNLNSDIIIYEQTADDKYEIEDMDDLESALEPYNDKKNYVLHLYVKSKEPENFQQSVHMEKSQNLNVNYVHTLCNNFFLFVVYSINTVYSLWIMMI